MYIAYYINPCMVSNGKKAWVLLNFIAGTYTNSYILLTWNMEDITP